MDAQVYRMRSTKHLLGKYQELREQQIYFAKPEEINDPMEGFREIVWKGDEIVWHNLFRNYISSLNLTLAAAKLTGDSSHITPEQLPIDGLVSESPSSMKTVILDEVCAAVFTRCKLHALIDDVASSDHITRRDELLFYLKAIHLVALEEIQKAHVRHRLSPAATTTQAQLKAPDYLSKLPALIRQLYREHRDLGPSAVTALFSHFNRVYDNLNVRRKYDARRQSDGRVDAWQGNRELIILDFPTVYISQIAHILYPAWYVACFLEDHRNSSVWGHYGDNHKGACLIFNVDDVSGHPGLALKRIVGSSGRKDGRTGEIVSKATWEYSPVSFHRVNYREELQELDFFRSIGVLPTGRLWSDWYTDSAGNRSKVSDHIGGGGDESWRKAYWQSFYRDITIKTQDWAYERETRLILASSITDLSEASKRKLTYKFESLNGIIFGMNMRDFDKLEIIDVVLKKCSETKRRSFDFYQAYYSREDKAIEKQKLEIQVPSR